MSDRLTVTIMKACEMTGVSRRTVYNWIAKNKIEYMRTAGGSIRIFVDTLFRQPNGTKYADTNSVNSQSFVDKPLRVHDVDHDAT